MHATILATFNEKEPAEALRARLEKEGVTAEVFDERKLQRYWFLSEPLAGIRLNVDKKDFDTARRLAQEWDEAEGVLREAVHCPQCRSARIEYPQLTRKFLTPELAGIFFALGLFDREFYCTDCHYTWPPKAKREVERDVLGWPKDSRLFGDRSKTGDKPETTRTP